MRYLKLDPHHQMVTQLAYIVHSTYHHGEMVINNFNITHTAFFLYYIGALSPVHAEETFSAMKAETPKSILKIEDFFPARHKWAVSTGTNVINKGDKGTSPTWYINEISPGNFIIDRTLLAWNKENNGISAYSNLKYGITNQLSISAILSGQWVNTRYTTENGNSVTKSRYRSNGVGLGGSYQFYRLSDYSVFYSGVNINNDDIKSYIFGSSFNWIYDPLVLSLSLGYLDGISKESFSTGYRAYTSSGNIIFAVNPEVKISWGVAKDFIFANNAHTNKSELISNMSLLMGTSINLVKNLVGSISIKGGLGNNSISTISLNLHYTM